jgi:MoaD family protein
MKIHVHFFSRLRELSGVSEMELVVQPGDTVTDLLAILYQRTPELHKWDQSILVAAGVEFVDRNYTLHAGDEISIMPPLQGG